MNDDSSGARALECIAAVAANPMLIVTASDGHTRAGCAVGFASQVSIEPARFLVCLSVANHTYRVAQRSKQLAIHVIDRAHLNLAKLFAETTGDDIDKFDRCKWHPTVDGVPILDDAAAWFTGPVLRRIRFGDHVGHLIAPGVGHAGQLDGVDIVTQVDLTDAHPGHPA